MKSLDYISSEALFFREAKKKKRLTNEETVNFIKQGKYNEVVNGNIPLAMKVLKSCTFVPMNGDNIGTAMMGLYEAATKFDYENFYVRFSTYAYPVIKSYLIRELTREQNLIHIPPYLMEDRERKETIAQYLKVFSLDRKNRINYQTCGDELDEIDKKFVAEKLLELAQNLGENEYELYKKKIVDGKTLEKISYEFGGKKNCTKQYVSFEMKNLRVLLKKHFEKDYKYEVSFT